MSAGTDGKDGNSQFAGAVISSDDISKIDGEEISGALENNNTSTLLEKHGLIIKTGPTGNNVSDIFAGFVTWN